MRIDTLLARQCPQCPALPICGPNQCNANQDCSLKLGGACECSSIICTDKSGSSDNAVSAKGPSSGALAGAVVGVVIFLLLSVGAYLFYRRRAAARAAAVGTEKIEVPASAADVLNRPDPQEKSAAAAATIRVYSSSSNTTIDLNPQSQPSITHTQPYNTPSTVRTNPFDDTHSIQTTSTGTSNVIPIALVTPGSDTGHQSLSQQQDAARSLSPMRPQRPRDLNLEHAAVSRDTLRPYAPSQISGISGVSSRNSYMSGASYSSDFLNEAPMIVTPSRQVLGVSKAEFIQTSGTASTPSTPMSASTLGAPAATSRRTLLSPLAATSFGPNDVLRETDEAQEIMTKGNPFSDEHSPYRTIGNDSPTSTFGQPLHEPPTASEWGVQGSHQWPADSRPVSSLTQAGAVIANIGSAKRVNVGLQGWNDQSAPTPTTADSFARSQHRTTIGRLVSPTSPATLQQQQQNALAHAQAQAGAYGLTRRTSASSAVSTSTRADSILESFHFVPPSPISARPMRSPPASPLAQKAFTVGDYPPQQHQIPALDPPNRKMLGMSTGSQMSTASSGLGSFPFQIESDGNELPQSTLNAAPSSFNNDRQRASLDTLALTSDLSSYPLGFDRR